MLSVTRIRLHHKYLKYFPSYSPVKLFMTGKFVLSLADICAKPFKVIKELGLKKHNKGA